MSSYNWKDLLITVNSYRVPPFTFSLEDLSDSERRAIESDRLLQRHQQLHWDEMNDDSFPASDAVARY